MSFPVRAALAWAGACALWAGTSTTHAAGWVAQVPFAFRSWEASDTTGLAKTQQWIVPAAASVPLTDAVRLFLQGVAHHTSVETQSTTSLSGLGDSQMGLSVLLADGRLLGQVGVNLPTGPRELDFEEQQVAVATAPAFLGYPLRQAGRGLDVGVAAALALPLAEPLSFSIGGGYLTRGSYVAVKGAEEVQPGGELAFTGGLDLTAGALEARLDVTRRMYAEDEGAGPTYTEPPVWEGDLRVGGGGQGWSAASRLLVSSKEEAEDGFSPASGTYLGAVLAVRRAAGTKAEFGAAGEIVRFRAEPDATGARFESTTGGFGPLVAWTPVPGFGIEARVMPLFGDLDGVSIEGWDARVTLRAAPRSGRP
jgi:hypothetical protein